MVKRPANYAQLVKQARAIATQGHVPESQLTTTAQAPATKLQEVRMAYAQGNYRKALAIAARFPQLGPIREAVLSAHGAYVSPNFYQQVGKDVEALKQAGIEALRTHYKL